MSRQIEVAVSSEITTTARGNLLEDLVRIILSNQQFVAGNPTRVTAMEIDVPAKHRVSGLDIIVECKAYRDRVSAETLQKLLGIVTFRNLDQGWLVVTAPLTKDAEGFKLEWEQKPPQERNKLAIYTPDRVIELLISTSTIVNPDKINGRDSTLSDEWVLLITNFGKFWANIGITSGVPNSVKVFYSTSGDPVEDRLLISRLSETDTSLAEHEWKLPNETKESAPRAMTESVVEVAMGDSWFDYRPSRPEHFVGRKESLHHIMDLFARVRSQSTATRLFSVCSLSGWGKSSLANKLKATCQNHRNRSKYYFYPVDVRAAESSSYVSLALLKALSSAIRDGFIRPPVTPLRTGHGSGMLSTESIEDCLDQLSAADKVIILFLDQFEEVFVRPEHIGLFRQLRSLSLEVDALRGNILLGFAWKTDANLPQDHPAYFLSQEMADRRLDIELPPFSERDVSDTLRVFGREIGEPLNPMLRTQLAQSSQGYPWLLKKLCIHVNQLMQTGLTQNQILERGLAVGSLFDDDLMGLSAEETLCLKEVARQAPASIVEIGNEYGSEMMTLINSRLIMRTGDRLIPYWDIFGDYLKTGETPTIPVSYLPGTEFDTFGFAILAAFFLGDISLKDLALARGMTERSMGNVLRDLRYFGLAERDGELIRALPEIGERDRPNAQMFVEHFARPMFRILQTHVFTSKLNEMYGERDQNLSDADLELALRAALPTVTLADRTWRVYAVRLAKYLVGVGILVRLGSEWELVEDPVPDLNFGVIRRGRGGFTADAPPDRVLKLIGHLDDAQLSQNEIDDLGLRNAANVLVRLGLIVKLPRRPSFTGSYLLSDSLSGTNISESIVVALEKTVSFNYAVKAVAENPGISGQDLGEEISNSLGCGWSIGSKKRVGSAMKIWVNWSRSRRPIAA